MSIKPKSNEFIKNREINSHHTETETENEVTLAPKPASHNLRRPVTNQMSNQNRTIETLNSIIGRYLVKLDALKTAKTNLSETEGSNDECENNPNAQNHQRLTKIRKTTVPHARDEFQPSYKPKIREPPTLYRRNSVDAVLLPPFETTTCVKSYLAKNLKYAPDIMAGQTKIRWFI